MNNNKISYAAIQMSYTVSDVEKKNAERALIYFNAAEKILNQSSDYLNNMKTPFKDNPDMSPEDIINARAVIRRFRDKAIENFNDFKKTSFECVNIMQTFASDTQTLKLVKSFITSIDELEAKVNKFSELFNDLQSKTFAKDIVDSIEEIQKQCDEVDEIIDDRLKSHIQKNILATSWIDAVSNDLDIKIEKKTPLIMDLYNKREDQMNEALKERTTLGN